MVLFRLCLVLLSLVLSPVVLGEEVVELDQNNFVRLVGEVNDVSASRFIQDLTIAAGSGLAVTVYIDSPGGDVLAGMRMLDAVAGLKAMHGGMRLTCFANTAASMAFYFLQVACDRRVVSVYSILMQHQSSLGVMGKAGEIQTRMDLVRQILEVLDRRVAARLGMSVEFYRARIVNDWWLVGANALPARAADTVGVVACSAELAAAKACPLAYALPPEK